MIALVRLKRYLWLVVTIRFGIRQKVYLSHRASNARRSIYKWWPLVILAISKPIQALSKPSIFGFVPRSNVSCIQSFTLNLSAHDQTNAFPPNAYAIRPSSLFFAANSFNVSNRLPYNLLICIFLKAWSGRPPTSKAQNAFQCCK